MLWGAMARLATCDKATSGKVITYWQRKSKISMATIMKMIAICKIDVTRWLMTENTFFREQGINKRRTSVR
jgi:hypothetical protein